MCFTLPTPEDPFNDLNDPVAKKEKQMNTDLYQRQKEAAALPGKSNGRKKSEIPVPSKPSSAANGLRHKRGKGEGGADAGSDDRVSKYLILCLKAIQEASSLDWGMDETDDLDQGGTAQQSPLLACKWGIDFWKSHSSGLDIVDSTGDCASRDQIAWLVSSASDIIARREKEGLVVPSPFLVFLVPSQDKASEVKKHKNHKYCVFLRSQKSSHRGGFPTLPFLDGERSLLSFRSVHSANHSSPLEFIQ